MEARYVLGSLDSIYVRLKTADVKKDKVVPTELERSVNIIASG